MPSFQAAPRLPVHPSNKLERDLMSDEKEELWMRSGGKIRWCEFRLGNRPWGWHHDATPERLPSPRSRRSPFVPHARSRACQLPHSATSAA